MPVSRSDPPSGRASGGTAPPPSFLSKTYEVVDDPLTDEIISWGEGDNSLVIWDEAEFASNLLPKYFKHRNFSSFVRQLNTYGFRKVAGQDRAEFANEKFLKGQKHLLNDVNRKKSGSVRVRVVKPELDKEIEGLKREKDKLMQEVVTLKQEQQVAGHQLQTLNNHLHQLESHQHKMVLFLAKAMQSPRSLNKIAGSNNKRRKRLPRKENCIWEEDKAAAFDGRIVKYDTGMNEFVAAIRAGLLKFDSCSKPNPNPNYNPNYEGLRVEKPPSQPAISDSSSCLVSEISQNSSVPLEARLEAVKEIGDIPTEDFVAGTVAGSSVPVDMEIEVPCEIEIANEPELANIMDSLWVELATEDPASCSVLHKDRNLDNLTVPMGLLASDSSGR